MMNISNNCCTSISASCLSNSTQCSDSLLIYPATPYVQIGTDNLDYNKLYDKFKNIRIGEIEDANKNLIKAICDNGGSFKIEKDPTTTNSYKAHIVIETTKLNRISVEVSDDFECNSDCVTDLIDRIDIYNDVVVKVSFKDGTFTKSVAESAEDFDIYTGIAFCLFKKFLGGNGHKNFNKMMRTAMKIFDKQEENKKKEEEEKKRQNEKRKKLVMKKKAKKMKEKEEAIDIQKQGYLRAMKECIEIE